MPEITLLLLGLLVVMFGLGFFLGWILRGARIQREKAAINVSWQDQMQARKTEHDRLAAQNKTLMEQVNQHQASLKDADRRTKELSTALKEALGLRDELRQKLKQSRGNVDVATSQRDQVHDDLSTLRAQNDAHASALKDKDEKIFNLSRELESWRNRLPPLMERFKLRDLEAEELEIELQKAQEQITALNTELSAQSTRIEPLETTPLANGMSASNEQFDEAKAETTAEDEELPLQDQKADADVSNDPTLNSDTYEVFASEGIHDFSTSEQDEAEPLTELQDLAAQPASATPEEYTPDINGNSATDDLQQIKGVGPAIEKTLHNLGIYRFAQIAQMSEYEIDRVARELRGFHSRIYREDWIGQAKLLEAGKPESLA